MIKEGGYCSKLIETEFNKPPVMTKKDQEDFQSSAKSWICKKAYEEDKVKLKDYNHITTKYQESVHQEYNLNLSLSKKIPVVFHNLQNYDSHLIFQEFGKHNFKINVTPKAIGT